MVEYDRHPHTEVKDLGDKNQKPRPRFSTEVQPKIPNLCKVNHGCIFTYMYTDSCRMLFFPAQLMPTITCMMFTPHITLLAHLKRIMLKCYFCSKCSHLLLFDKIQKTYQRNMRMFDDFFSTKRFCQAATAAAYTHSSTMQIHSHDQGWHGRRVKYTTQVIESIWPPSR